MLQSLGRLAGPAAGLGLVSWLGWHFVMEPLWSDPGFIRRTFMLGLTITAAGTAYMMLATVAKADEAEQFMDLARRNWGVESPSPRCLTRHSNLVTASHVFSVHSS